MLRLILDQVAGSQDETGDDDDSEFNSIVEIRTDTADDTEEQRHGNVAHHDQEVEGEEGASGSRQVRHEVHNDGKDHDAYGRERGIDENLGDPKGRRPVVQQRTPM